MDYSRDTYTNAKNYQLIQRGYFIGEYFSICAIYHNRRRIGICHKQHNGSFDGDRLEPNDFGIIYTG